jgi:para-nitrobenzyl esterase
VWSVEVAPTAFSPGRDRGSPTDFNEIHRLWLAEGPAGRARLQRLGTIKPQTLTRVRERNTPEVAETVHAHPSPIVHTAEGPVRGLIADGMRQYLGIPYASPPTGDLRWRPPQTLAGWQEPLDTVAFGSVCAQDTSCLPGFGYFSDTEDCLYLNVFVPEDSQPGPNLPVMVWIPGGGLIVGGSTDYDPSALVKDGNIVFVSINYRLNIFGFFSHPAINGEGHAAGNYGIMDQQAALRWVQRNIEKFGGNPNNVTIFGESAGAISVLSHIASPGSTSLFHRAILQSCSVAATTATPRLESLEHIGVALASAAGCRNQSAENLRSITTTELMRVDTMPEGTFGTGQYHVGLIADGTVIPEPMRNLFESGRFNRVPVINGVNRDEFSWFQAMIELSTGQTLSDDDYPRMIGTALKIASDSALLGATVPPEAVPEILKRYPAQAHPGASRALAAAIGDAGLITNGGWRTTRMIRKFVPEVYAYEFDVPDSPVSWPDVSFPYGSGHVQEIQYLFPLFRGGGGIARELSEPQKRLAKQMVSYWTTFAHRGNPNAQVPDTPFWPVYEPNKDNFMLLRTPNPTVVTSYGNTHQCEFWGNFYEASQT